MDESTYGTLTTVGGWVAILSVGGALWWNYKNSEKGRKRNLVPKQQSWKPSADLDLDEGSTTKKKPEKASKPKSKAKAPSKPSAEATTSATAYNAASDVAENKDLDREFAKQFSNVQAGKQFTASKKDETRQKSVKQSRAQERDETVYEKTSVPSSTTGDADDDLSPAVSPAVQAADSRDVSDMLEKAPAGPSVLRLTDTDKSKTKQKMTKAPEVVETKKQRQNRKKAEAAKVEREEAEKERKVKMEAQRRAARIAEGRAAKDGSTFTANKDSVWKGSSTNGTSDHLPVQPLDTFEQKSLAQPPMASKPAAATATKERSDSWMSDLPSEEEQLERLKVAQLEDSWNEVKSKKGKGKKKDVQGDDFADTPREVIPTPSAPSVAKPRAPTNGTTQKKPTLASNSSFAALTPADDDDDVEEEWDV